MPDEILELEELEELDAVEVDGVPTPRLRVVPAVEAPSKAISPRKPPSGLSVDELPSLIEAAETYFGAEMRELEPLQQLVVIAYMGTGNWSRACSKVGASIMLHRGWIASVPVYREIVMAAEDSVTDVVEETTLREALITRDKTLLLGLLKGRRREKYGNAAPVEKDREANSWSELTKKMAEEGGA